MGSYQQDENRLRQLQKGKDADWKAWHTEVKEAFQLFFLQHGRMDSEEAKALFHEAMVVFHRKVTAGTLQTPLKSTLKTYLIGIGKMLCRRKGKPVESALQEIPDIGEEPDVLAAIDVREQGEFIRNLLNRVGASCRKLLEMIYFDDASMKEVADELELATEGAARKRKFDCLKKMRSML
ncbi:MAG: sigma-70 family RNA polymerase sigma factor [Saprospiraceae bacterium]|nr:sigma-70 family RNA polymerase sigma factor [Saprospiraceae bacterium]